MKRDMMKTVETVKGKKLIPRDYSMNADELMTICEMFQSGKPFDAITIAFDYGFVLGARAQKAGKFHAK